MNDGDGKKLEALRSNYTAVVGSPFETFFCPILFRDDNVALCRAHLVNQAFSNASRRWTIQRKDIDQFYGAFFESDFVTIDLRREVDLIQFSGQVD